MLHLRPLHLPRSGFASQQALRAAVEQEGKAGKGNQGRWSGVIGGNPGRNVGCA